MSEDRQDLIPEHFVDAELERLLKESKELDYVNLQQMLDLVTNKFLQAHETAERQTNDLNSNAKHYYFTILFEYVWGAIYRFFCRSDWFNDGKKSTKEQILLAQTVLSDWLYEMADRNITVLEPLNTTFNEVSKLRDLITHKETELDTINMTIEGLDNALHQGHSNPDVMRTKEEIRDGAVTSRDNLSKEIIVLYQRIDEKMAGLAAIPGLEITQRTSYVGLKAAQIEKISSLKAFCLNSSHIVAAKLGSYLTHQTTASRSALQQALNDHPDYLDVRLLADAVWDAVLLYPAITEGISREAQVLELIQKREQEVLAIHAHIEGLDAAFNSQPRDEILTEIRACQERKMIVSEEIHTLLLANQHAIPNTDRTYEKPLY